MALGGPAIYPDDAYRAGYEDARRDLRILMAKVVTQDPVTDREKMLCVVLAWLGVDTDMRPVDEKK